MKVSAMVKKSCTLFILYDCVVFGSLMVFEAATPGGLSQAKTGS